MVDRDTIRRGYDDLAETYAEERSETGRDVTILAEFLDSLSDPERILDAGCGGGRPVLQQLDRRATAIGLDVSHGQLRLADETVPTAPLLQGEMTRLPLRDETVDAITAYHSIIHVPLEEHQSTIDEFGRVLRPGGQVLLTEGPEAWSGTNPDWLDSGVEMQWNIAGAETTRNQLRNAGFTVIDEWNDTGNSHEEHWVFFAARLDA